MPQHVVRLCVGAKFLGDPVSKLVEAGVFDGMPVVETMPGSIVMDFIDDSAHHLLAELESRFDVSQYSLMRTARFRYSMTEIRSARWVCVECMAGVVVVEENSYRRLSSGLCPQCGLPAHYKDLPQLNLDGLSGSVLFTNNGEHLIRSALLSDAYVARNPRLTAPCGTGWTVLREGAEFPALERSSTGFEWDQVCGACSMPGFWVDSRNALRVVVPSWVRDAFDEDVAFSLEHCGERIENEHISTLPSRMLFVRGSIAEHFIGQQGVTLDVVQYSSA